MVIGAVLRLHISSRWLMRSTGVITILPVGSRFPQLQEVLSILHRMGYCFAVIYTISLTRMKSRLIQTHVSSNLYEDKVANYYFRTVTKLYTLALIMMELLENILIKDFLMILKDHQMSSSGGIFDKRFSLI